MVSRIFHVMMGRDGGTERFFLRLTQGFHEAGIEQEFAVRPGQVWLPELEGRGRVHQGTYLRRDPVSLIRLWALRRRMAGFDPDVIMGWRGPTARLIPKWGRVKLVRLGDFPFHVRHFGHLDTVVANTPDIVDHIRGQGWMGRAEVISNFPPERAVGAGTPVLPEGPRPVGGRVAGLGRFVSSKGFDTLIRAMVDAPDAELWLIGGGPQEGDLRNLAEDLGVAGRVRFLGWQTDILPYLSACDIFVMPSRDEPLGNVILEAWAAGLPVVATRSQGPMWYGVDGGNMMLVDLEDAPAMGAAIARLGADPGLRARLAEAGAQTLAERFSKEAVVARYLSLFDEIATDKNGGRG
jgi:glycosyltransferase involved in cell wall biosynthesis